MGAAVNFQTTVMRAWDGFSTGNPIAPVVLSVSQSTVQSDVYGFASLLPSAGSFTGTLQVAVSAATGTTAWLQSSLQVFPPIVEAGGPAHKTPPSRRLVPYPIRGYWPVERNDEMDW
jgi:hypothetical protein